VQTADCTYIIRFFYAVLVPKYLSSDFKETKLR